MRRVWGFVWRLALLAAVVVPTVIYGWPMLQDELDDNDDAAAAVEVPESERFVSVFPASSITSTKFAVVGDLQSSNLVVTGINADDDLRFVMHLGNATAADTPCNQATRSDASEFLNSFEAPVLFTPGDNDWQDCHLVAESSCSPVECLNELRSEVAPYPGRSLGEFPAEVSPQDGYPENQRWVSHRVVFATIHTVNNGNGRAEWTGDAAADQDPARMDEVTQREEAAIEWLEEAFAAADSDRVDAVVIAMHANTIDGFNLSYADFNARFKELAVEFDRPVLLLHAGDGKFVHDVPWDDAPNLRRLQVYGDNRDNWIEVSVTPGSKDVFFFELMGKLDLPLQPDGVLVVGPPVADGGDPLPVGPA